MGAVGEGAALGTPLEAVEETIEENCETIETLKHMLERITEELVKTNLDMSSVWQHLWPNGGVEPKPLGHR